MEYKADLVCLAGFMLKLGPKCSKTFSDRIMNVHQRCCRPSAAKGFYGMKVHEAVLAAGVRVSGATVHLLNDEYDSGPYRTSTGP